MGGTSFDCALIDGGEVGLAHRAELNRFLTGLSLVDITAIGAGGGSIAWIDSRGMPRVGPRSAGSVPGPACYGRGGEEPTVTDATLALGFIDPDYFLGGTMEVDRGLAEAAIQKKIGDPLGWEMTEAAAAIWTIVVQSMSAAVRAVSIEKGHDPREFTLVQYGGAGALFSAPIARSLGISRVIIPGSASTFSAAGLMHADSRRSLVQTINWNVLRESPDRALAAYRELAAAAREELRADGFEDEAIEVKLEGDLKFIGQAFEVTMQVDLEALDSQRVYDQFVTTYESDVRRGHRLGGLRRDAPQLPRHRDRPHGETGDPAVATNGGDPEAARKASREVFMPDAGRAVEMSVYSDERLAPGARISGPAILELRDTTIYVPEDAELGVDEFANYVMEVR